MCGVPVLVFANKQDLLQALAPDQVISVLLGWFGGCYLLSQLGNKATECKL